MYKPKKKSSFVEVLEIIGKSITILASAGVILGGFLSYSYLSFIRQPSVFTDAISNPSSLASILITFVLTILALISPYIFPHILIPLSKDVKQEKIAIKNLLPSLSIAPLTFIAIITYIYLFNDLPKIILEYISYISILLPVSVYLIQITIKNRKDIEIFILKFVFYAIYYLVSALILFPIIIIFTIPALIYLIIFSNNDIKNRYIIKIIDFSKKLKNYFSQNKNKKRKNKITEEITTLLLFIMIIILSSATTFLYSLVFIIMTNDWLPGEETQYLYLLFLGIMMLLNAFLVSRFIRYQKNNKNDHKKVLIFPCMIAFFSLLLIVILSENFSVRMLYPVRFTEIPQNSSWYLLHNNFQQNNGFQETSGIDRNDLLKLKQKFKCSALSETEKVEKGISCSSIPEQRNNALYGYMAWNLGDTKVFCPPTAENNKGKKEAAKLATECIVISGKFLQILNENYIDIMPKER